MRVLLTEAAVRMKADPKHVRPSPNVPCPTCASAGFAKSARFAPRQAVTNAPQDTHATSCRKCASRNPPVHPTVIAKLRCPTAFCRMVFVYNAHLRNIVLMDSPAIKLTHVRHRALTVHPTLTVRTRQNPTVIRTLASVSRV